METVKKVNSVGGVACRPRTDPSKTVTLGEGPTVLVQVPTCYTGEELDELLDLMMSLPADVVSNVVVVREDVVVSHLSY